jgi:DNA-binding CsgD family transcriptional regulator
VAETELPAEHYAQLEQAIYEAAVIPEQWPDVLRSLAGVGEGLGAVLFSVSHHGALWTASPEMREIMRHFVEDGWADRNTRMSRGLAKGLHLVPRFVTENDYYLPGEPERDPLYTEFFWPNGVGHSAGMLALLPHEDMICISIEKPWEEGPVTPRSLAWLDSLRPHIARAAMLTARLGLEQIRSAVDALGRLGFASAAVTAAGKVLVASDGFVSEAEVWTTVGRDRLVLVDPRADAQLRSALLGIRTAGGTRSIPLRDDQLVVRNVLHVLPVRRAAHDIFVRAEAIVVMTTSSTRQGSPHLLQALFDLTPAEAAVASHVGAGLTLNDIAAREGRSVATVRNQLKSVLAKTGCSRQAELTRMLALLVPPGM